MSEPTPGIDARAFHRYAVYFAPALDSAWWRVGSSWLGRCAASGQPLPQPALAGIPTSEQARLTASPRRYGWHATLKAPFALARGADRHQLQARLMALSQDLQPFDMPPLKVALLGNFLALVPLEQSARLQDVASACVMRLHELAAPPLHEDVARRLGAGLAPDEAALLAQWGYPFVMHRFRFHMSLTGPLDGTAPALVHLLQEAAASWFEPLPALKFDSLTLFAEPAAGADFVVLKQFALRAPGHPI